MPWIHTIPVEEATGVLAQTYAWQARAHGKPTEFTQLGSLIPEVANARLGLYKATENAPSAITDFQRAVLSSVTSHGNQTPHCASIARVKLRELGSPAATISAIENGDYDDLDPVAAALARYARKLTRDPGAIRESDILALRAVGLGDVEIADANNHVAHLNYVNRIANGLGLRHEIAEDTAAVGRVPK
jgi:uncharacterized peroxidase-related enzyme